MANPMYSPWLEYAPTFRWGGREWGEGAGGLDAFMKKIGGPKKYQKWARKHRIAAKAFDPTEGYVYSQVQPVITGIDAERKKRADYYQRLMGNLAGFTSALGPMLSGVDDDIGGAYREAAETVGATGRGFGVNLNNASAAAAEGANQVLGAINAPGGQMLQGGDAGGVLAGLAGWIPETMLNTEGGAWAAAASQLPKTAGLEAQYMMKGILDKAKEEEEDYSTQITELLQKVPGFRTEAKTVAQTNALKKQEFALKQMEAKRDWYLDQAKLAFLSKDYEMKNKYLELARQEEQRAVWESQGRDATGAVAPDFHIEGGRVVENGWHLDKNGIPKQNKSPNVGVSGGAAAGAPAKAAIAKIDESADNIASDIAAMTEPEDDGTFVIPGLGDKETKTKKLTYGKAFASLYNSYKHLTKGNARADKYLKTLIRSKLIGAGIKPKAGGG